MTRILVDFHHTSLLRSLIMLFEDRYKFKVYRPIGLSWYTEGYWKINAEYETAKQYLSLEQVPNDGTPPLNRLKDKQKGMYYCYDGGSNKVNRACTLEYFKRYKFDYVLCSIPAHIEPYKRLIKKYNPKAKLIVQVGNEWPIEIFRGNNVLASIKPRDIPESNTVFYHQEFDTNIFSPNFNKRERFIYSFVNVLQEKPRDYELFMRLEKIMPQWTFKMYGGQNRDGNLNGEQELSDKMKECAFAFHCKTGGDGYGHILWNNAFCATPLITRYEDYHSRLGESLIAENTSILVDGKTPQQIAEQIDERYNHAHKEMSQKIHEQAVANCDFDKEAEDIRSWLENL